MLLPIKAKWLTKPVHSLVLLDPVSYLATPNAPIWQSQSSAGKEKC